MLGGETGGVGVGAGVGAGAGVGLLEPIALMFEDNKNEKSTVATTCFVFIATVTVS